MTPSPPHTPQPPARHGDAVLPQRGDSVRIRAERWRVADVVAGDACTMIECAGLEPSNAGTTARFLLPFETVEAAPMLQQPRLVRPAVWRRIAAEALSAVSPRWRSLRCAARAAIDLLPYQLEPALAMTAGRACRFLLADEVGLGKTVQAGLLVAELLARHRDARVLIVTPAGLREQWREELRGRFAIDAAILDAPALARAAADLPPGVNPWATYAVAVTSIDFLKRADVIRALEPLAWDLVAFDEAHALCGRSDRAAAAELVAARARRVVLITATPHNGDDDAFERLRNLGRIDEDDRLLTFRRSRSSAGLASARVERQLAVVPGPEEARMHRALEGYGARVARERGAAAGAARLAVMVLQRRAASGAAALARSIERRMSLLAGDRPAPQEQLRLPLEDGCTDEDDEPSSELGAPGLHDAASERRWLGRILELARGVRRECKVARLQRLLARVREPVVIFTEYRDTLRHVAAALELECAMVHGGMAADERAREIRRFTHGTVAVLLATDAASEGLNLHRRCRLVVNLDMPWTPLRLEQRVGRVDRIGQQRAVHAITLAARGTLDAQVAATLATRAARAAREAPFAAEDESGPRQEAAAEADRLTGVRRLLADAPTTAPVDARPVVTVLRRGCAGRLLLAVRLFFVDSTGAAVWETIAGLAIEPDEALEPLEAGRPRAWFEAARQARAIPIAAAATALHDAALAKVRAEACAEADAQLARERSILQRIARDQARLAAPVLQAGLFDRRALRERDAQRRLAREAIARSRRRIAEIERQRTPGAGTRSLVFAAAWLR